MRSGEVPDDVWLDVAARLDVQDRACLSEVDGKLSRLFRWDRLRRNDLLKLQVLRYLSGQYHSETGLSSREIERKLCYDVTREEREAFRSQTRYVVDEPGLPTSESDKQSVLLIDRLWRNDAARASWEGSFPLRFEKWVSTRLPRTKFDTFRRFKLRVTSFKRSGNIKDYNICVRASPYADDITFECLLEAPESVCSESYYHPWGGRLTESPSGRTEEKTNLMCIVRPE